MTALRKFAALSELLNRITFTLGAGFIFILLSIGTAHADDPISDPSTPTSNSPSQDPSQGSGSSPTSSSGSSSGDGSSASSGSNQSQGQTENQTGTTTNTDPRITSAQTTVEEATLSLNEAITAASPGQQSAASSSVIAAQEALNIASTAISNAISAEAAVEEQLIVVSDAEDAVTTATENLEAAESAVEDKNLEIAVIENDIYNDELVITTDTAAIPFHQQQVNDATAAKAAADAVVAAATQPGLDMKVTQNIGYNNAPPVEIGTTTFTTTVSQINQNWGSGAPANTFRDDFQVKYTGQITSDTTSNIRFYAPADDGVKLYLDGQLVINDWYDKGGGGSVSQPVAFTANNPKSLTLHFYENGGGANVQLQWNRGSGWQIVPSSAFSRSSATPEQIAAAQAAANDLNLALTNQSLNLQELSNAQGYLATHQAQLEVAQSELAVLTEAQSEAEEALELAQTTLETENSTLSTLLSSKEEAITTADQLASAALVAVSSAVSALEAPLTPPTNGGGFDQGGTQNPGDMLGPDVPNGDTPSNNQGGQETPQEDTQASTDQQTDSSTDSTEGQGTTDQDSQETENGQTDGTDESQNESNTEESEQQQSDTQEQDNQSQETSPEPTTTEEAVNQLLEEANGEPISAEAIKEAGLSYSDLPPGTPVEVRTDEKGNPVIINAEVAAALVLLENPAELLGALFDDPGKALAALGNIGADMSPEEREEATKMVVATVIATGAALNAVGLATGGSSPSAPSGGGGGSGGGSSGENKAVRRRRENT